MSTCRKSHARTPWAWAARNCRQVGDARRGAGFSRAALRILRIVPSPTRRAEAEAEEFALDAPISPARVLPGQLLDELADLLWDGWASSGVRVGPFSLDQAPVPGEQRARGHDPVHAEVRRQQPGQGGEHGAVGPVRLRPGDLAAEDGDLMTEHQDLCVLCAIASREEHQPAEEPDHDQVDEADEHERRA